MLLKDNENTEYGKKYGFSDIHNADEYRKKVPLTVYDNYAHYVEIGNMGKLELKFLQPQTFQLYRELKMYREGISENQLKPVRVLDTPKLVSFFTALEEK